MAIKTRRPGQYRIFQCVANKDDNPLTWNEEIYARLNNERVIGYAFIPKEDKFNERSLIINLYTIGESSVAAQDEITLDEIKTAFQEWLLKLDKNKKAYYWRNPPLELWLDTKREWLTKQCYRFAKQYSLSYDEVLSHAYCAIIKCYNRGYIGSLNYVQKAVNNEILMSFRQSRRDANCIPSNVSIDTIIEHEEDSDTPMSAILGQVDERYDDYDFEKVKQQILSVLRFVFSDREIEQILNCDGKASLLPRSLYVKLNRWRSTHKKEDFECLK